MKLLITGGWKYEEPQLFEIKRLGHEVILMPDEKGDLPCPYGDVEGVICNGLFLYHPIEKFKQLKYIQITSAGLDRIPVDYISSHGIKLNNAGGVYSSPMAEFAIASVLSVYKHLDNFRSFQNDRIWKKDRSLLELSGKTVCIVGCGNVGGECAKRFSAMGCKVVGVDTFLRNSKWYDLIFSVDALKDSVASADIVILSLPLTADTYHLINKDILSGLASGAILINMARGAVVDTDALIDVLIQRTDVTAILDVFEEEPLSEKHPLWGLPNVLITPHNSFVGENNGKRLWTIIKDNLCGYEI